MRSEDKGSWQALALLTCTAMPTRTVGRRPCCAAQLVRPFVLGTGLLALALCRCRPGDRRPSKELSGGSKQANERRGKQILAPPRRTRNRNDRRPGPTCRRRTAPPPKRPRNVRPLSSLREVDASVLLLIPTYRSSNTCCGSVLRTEAYQWMSGYESTEAEGTGQRERYVRRYEY